MNIMQKKSIMCKNRRKQWNTLHSMNSKGWTLELVKF